MAREVTLEAAEWYVLTNWLRERENRLMYALRSRSKKWEFVHETRRHIDEGRGDTAETDDPAETGGAVQTVVLSDAQFARLVAFLRRRAFVLRFEPWRYRERRDVIHLRRQLRSAAATVATERPELG